MAVLPFAAVEVPRKAVKGLLPSPLSAPMLRRVSAVPASCFPARLVAVAADLGELNSSYAVCVAAAVAGFVAADGSKMIRQCLSVACRKSTNTQQTYTAPHAQDVCRGSSWSSIALS
jgi:hypothetical protein